MKTALPKGVTQKHLEYLDRLRKSGVTNMFGAGAYVQREFGLERAEAKTILLFWMDTFGERVEAGEVKD